MNHHVVLALTATAIALGVSVACEGKRVGNALGGAGSPGGSGGAATAGDGGNSGGGTPSNSQGGSTAGAAGNLDGGAGGTSAGAAGDGGEAGDGGGSGACSRDGTSTRGPALVCIPGGTFMMGFDSPETQNALPIHEQTVASFYMDETEVTLSQYFECTSDAACSEPGSTWFDDVNCNYGFKLDARGTFPINCVLQGQAEDFCEWADKRLPTEIEWEYAARGSMGRTYPWGETAPVEGIADPHLCWIGMCSVNTSADGKTPDGLADLAGNVWELTASPFCPYTESGLGTPCDEVQRVIRGGGWQDSEAYVFHGAYRSTIVYTAWRTDVGFRCARQGVD